MPACCKILKATPKIFGVTHNESTRGAETPSTLPSAHSLQAPSPPQQPPPLTPKYGSFKRVFKKLSFAFLWAGRQDLFRLVWLMSMESVKRYSATNS